MRMIFLLLTFFPQKDKLSYVFFNENHYGESFYISDVIRSGRVTVDTISSYNVEDSDEELGYFFTRNDKDSFFSRNIAQSEYDYGTYHVPVPFKDVSISQFDCSTIHFETEDTKINLFYDTVENIEINPPEYSLEKCKVKIQSICESKIGKLNVYNAVVEFVEEFYEVCNVPTKIDSLIFTDCQFINKEPIRLLEYPKFIRLDNISFLNGALLDLSGFKNGDTSRCVINFGEGGDWISNLKFDYSKFHLFFDSSVSKVHKEIFYKQLLAIQERNNFTTGYEIASKEYKQFKYSNDGKFGLFLNWIDREWWDYGYRRFQVIPNSLKVFFLVVLLNILIYRNLTNVYFPKKFQELESTLSSRYSQTNTWLNKIRNRIIRIPAIIVYSGYIFWGLKIDLKELELRKPIFFSIIIIEYVLGIICLAYIANYVITK